MRLTVEHVTVRRGRRAAVEDLSLQAEAGVVSLVGPNGSGKSSLLAAVAGVLPVRTGRVVVDGIPVGRRTLRQLARVLGYAPQNLRLPASMTVRDVCEYAAWLREVPRARVRERTAAALEMAGLSERATSRVGNLSGGFQRRLVLAQALMHDPAVLVLDEPTSELDPEHRAVLRESVAHLARERLVVISTHILEDVATLDAQLLILDEGRCRFLGSAKDLTRHVAADGGGAGTLEQGYRQVLVNGKAKA